MSLLPSSESFGIGRTSRTGIQFSLRGTLILQLLWK